MSDDGRDEMITEIVQSIARLLLDENWMDEGEANEFADTEAALELGGQILSNIESHYGM